MKMNSPVVNLVFVFLILISSAGCASMPDFKNFTAPDSEISEISLSSGGGPIDYWYQIILRKDGTAEYLGDVSPERRGENMPFGQSTGENSRIRYSGTISPAQFESIAKLVKENEFFSMKEDNGGVSGAPQITTSATKNGTRKEVRNQLGKGGEKLAEIERAVSRAADQINWQRVTK